MVGGVGGAASPFWLLFAQIVGGLIGGGGVAWQLHQERLVICPDTPVNVNVTCEAVCFNASAEEKPPRELKEPSLRLSPFIGALAWLERGVAFLAGGGLVFAGQLLSWCCCGQRAAPRLAIVQHGVHARAVPSRQL